MFQYGGHAQLKWGYYIVYYNDLRGCENQYIAIDPCHYPLSALPLRSFDTLPAHTIHTRITQFFGISPSTSCSFLIRFTVREPPLAVFVKIEVF